MNTFSFKRHRFPPTVIRHSIWLYARFTLSYRDIEEMLAERDVDVSYETVKRWFLKFGPGIAANLRRLRPRRNAKAAKKLMKKLLKEQGFVPTRIVNSPEGVVNLTECDRVSGG